MVIDFDRVDMLDTDGDGRLDTYRNENPLLRTLPITGTGLYDLDGTSGLGIDGLELYVVTGVIPSLFVVKVTSQKVATITRLQAVPAPAIDVSVAAPAPPVVSHGSGDAIITVDGRDYECTDTFKGYECFRFSPFGDPDLYCDGFNLECSPDWYPSDLDDYERVPWRFGDYLCRPAMLGSSFGDFDCGRYDGGDPARVWFEELYCSRDGAGFICDEDDYPSELAKLTFLDIDRHGYVCRDALRGGLDCWRWNGIGSPVDATKFGLADYHCSPVGCEES